ncbi:MAG TPA: DUF4388 domain-containing protein [Anaerolineae bacterium]|nr:DUF4388 domain-containing protein [Anaerolineae bacterium]
MALKGSLKDMGVADLIQHNCQDRKIARLDAEHKGQQATLFFEDGRVTYASLDDLRGEEVIYKILNWSEGSFTLEIGPNAPEHNVTRSWSALLLEGAKRLDEAGNEANNDVIISQTEDKPMAKRKSEVLADKLAEMLQDSSDIDGAAIVGFDGLVYSANVPQRALDETMVGASSAALLGLSNRTVEQLKRGNFKQSLVQGDDGNIIVTGINAETLFVALTPANVNLGMAFAEVRSIVAELKDIL